MIIFPAIDIKDGKCVRLLKGDFNKITSYDKSPVDPCLTHKESVKVVVFSAMFLVNVVPAIFYPMYKPLLMSYLYHA